MTVKKWDSSPKSPYYTGLNSDIKPTDAPDGSIFEELDSGSLWKYIGGSWKWFGATKELGHNRAMLGLKLSYKVSHRNNMLAAEHAVYRISPAAVKFHHAEGRIFRPFGGHTRLRIFVGNDIGNLPAVVSTPSKDNQNGMELADRNAQFIFDFHGNVSDATLATILTGATQVDEDYMFAEEGVGNKASAAAQSAITSGRIATPNVEYLMVIEPDPTNTPADIGYFYSYFWHEG